MRAEPTHRPGCPLPPDRLTSGTAEGQRRDPALHAHRDLAHGHNRHPLPRPRRRVLHPTTTIAAETVRPKGRSRPSLGRLFGNRIVAAAVPALMRRRPSTCARRTCPGRLTRSTSPGHGCLRSSRVNLIGNETLALGALPYAGQLDVMVVADRNTVSDLRRFGGRGRQRAGRTDSYRHPRDSGLVDAADEASAFSTGAAVASRQVRRTRFWADRPMGPVPFLRKRCASLSAP